jgi:hypothetical protein
MGLSGLRGVGSPVLGAKGPNRKGPSGHRGEARARLTGVFFRDLCVLPWHRPPGQVCGRKCFPVRNGKPEGFYRG